MLADFLGIGSLLNNFLTWIKEGIIWCVNQIILSIGALIAYVISLLPNMPTLPTLPTDFDTWIGYGAYWFPIGFTLTLGASLLVLWAAWMVIAIPLRWAKATRGAE